jgi:hypothetical protein
MFRFRSLYPTRFMRPQGQRAQPSSGVTEALSDDPYPVPGPTEGSALFHGGFPHGVVFPDLLGECSRSVHRTCPEHVGHRPSPLLMSSAGLAFDPAVRSQIR